MLVCEYNIHYTIYHIQYTVYIIHYTSTITRPLADTPPTDTSTVVCEYNGSGRTSLHAAAGYGRINDVLELLRVSRRPLLCTIVSGELSL